ncbi:MAG: hypothetical protein ABIJ97_10340 [Bacteroidota bacterium]
MKKSVLSVLVVLFISAFITSTVFSQAIKPQKTGKTPQEKSKNVINKTSNAIFEAQLAVKEGKNYTGDLATAIRHQKFAQKLYSEKEFIKAAEHSLYARKHAVAACKANNRIVKPEYEKQPTAEVAATLRPDSDLVNEIASQEEINEQDFTQGEAVNMKVE